MRLDLNCDLGEGEPLVRTRALMRWITSANVACGAHAGDFPTMIACAKLARKFDVRLGAHPGLPNRGDFGRGQAATTTPAGLELLLLQQIGALERIAWAHGTRLHHVKLHGALYHAVDENGALGRRFVESVGRWWPGCKIYARAGGRTAALGAHAGIEVWPEAFADRAYRENGTLVARTERGALIADPFQAARRAQTLIEQGRVDTVSGRLLEVEARTLCLHADTPGALRLARAIRKVLSDQAG